MVSLSITFLIINLLIIYLVFKGINRLIKPRISKVLAFRLFVAYGVVLLLSPLIVAFALDLEHSGDRVPTPDYYYSDVLQDYRNQTLEGLMEDEHLYLANQTTIPINAFDFSEDQPLLISPRHQGNDYAFHMIVEITDNVDTPVITQFNQRADIDGIDITEEFIPWNWTITGNRLQAEIERTEIDIYIVTAIHHYFHFDGERQPMQNIFHHTFSSIGTIQWIQLPADLPFEFLGDQEFLKIIDRR